MRASALWQGKALVHLENMPAANENMLITHTEWQLNEVQLTYTMVDKGMQKNEKWGLPGSQKKPSGCLGFPRALTVRFIYSHGLPALGADCCFRGHQDDKSRAMKG